MIKRVPTYAALINISDDFQKISEENLTISNTLLENFGYPMKIEDFSENSVQFTG